MRSRWRASRRVRKKKKRERMSKVKHVKFCCSRCCNSSSHGDLIRGGLQSHSEKFISISRSKTRACRVLFLPPPLSFSTIHTRFTPSLSVPRFVVNGHREWTRRKGIHFVPFDGDETQTRPYLFLSFSFFFFPPYSSADIYPFSISMTLNLSSR